MATQQSPPFKVDRYVIIHVATTCDEHGVYVTKDSAEVIELGWILLDANTLDEVGHAEPLKNLGSRSFLTSWCLFICSFTVRACSSSPSTLPSLLFAVSPSPPSVPADQFHAVLHWACRC